MILSNTRVIAVTSGRGGSGKSVVTGALSWVLVHLMGLRLAVVDLDAQGSLSTYLGIPRARDPLCEPARSTHDLMLYAGGAAIGGASFDDMTRHITRATGNVDVVVVDCPPDLTSVAHTALMSLPPSLVLGVARLEPGSVAPIQSVTAIAERLQVPHVVLPNAETSKANATGTLMALQAMYGERTTLIGGAVRPVLLPYQVPNSEFAPSSITKRTPFTALRPGAAPSKVVARLAADLRSWGVV